MISIEDHRYVILILMDLTVEETKEKVIRQMQMKTAEVAQTVIDDQTVSYTHLGQRGNRR